MNRLVTILKTVVWGILGIILGVILKRFLLDTGMVAESGDFTSLWIVFVSALAVLAGAIYALTFFLKENEKSEEPLFQPATMKMLLPEIITIPRRYTLVLIIAAAMTFAFMPGSLLIASQSETKTVSAARHITGFLIKEGRSGKSFFSLIKEEGVMFDKAEPVKRMVIDGNRNGQFVIFPHDDHAAIIGDENSCGSCHHLNLPFDSNSSCFECHQNMVASTDIFSHTSHVNNLGGNHSCRECHKDNKQIKSRSTTTACLDCHQDMAVTDSLIPLSNGRMTGIAVGYKAAMHGLCISCHEDSDPALAECTVCHQDNAEKNPFRRMKPYRPSPERDN